MATPDRPTDVRRARPTTVALVVRPPGSTVSGGHRYNARLIEAAPEFGCTMRLVAPSAWRVPTADVVVIDSLDAWKVPIAVRRASRTPTVALLHQRPGGTDGSRARQLVQRPLDVSTYRSCDLLLASSAAVAADLEAVGIERSRITLVRPGCDLPPVTACAPLRGDRQVGLLTVSNWLPNKGIVDLLDAFASLPADAATLHLVGRTDLVPRYEAAVRERLRRPELADRVVVHGQLPPSSVAPMYRAADAFVFPSHRESYGTVAAEALASGLPVIGWRAPHLTSLIDDGVDGLLVDHRDLDALGDAMHRLATDAPLRDTLTAHAVCTGAALPTWSDTVREFFAAVSGLIA